MISQQPPRYRALKDTLLPGPLYRKGSEFEFMGWPNGHEVEPVNEAARRVVAYPHRTSAMCPGSPWNRTHGRYFLPAVTAGAYEPSRRNEQLWRWLPSPIQAKDATDDMPKYRVTASGMLGQVRVDPGDIVAYLAWPMIDILQPTNEPARKVKAYYEANRENPLLLSAPWCCFDQALFLPELPEVVKAAPIAGVYRDNAAGGAARRSRREVYNPFEV